MTAIERILYFDPQQAPFLPCPRCRREVYSPSYTCQRCQRDEP